MYEHQLATLDLVKESFKNDVAKGIIDKAMLDIKLIANLDINDMKLEEKNTHKDIRSRLVVDVFKNHDVCFLEEEKFIRVFRYDVAYEFYPETYLYRVCAKDPCDNNNDYHKGLTSFLKLIDRV